MPTITPYVYSVAADLPGGAVNLTKLQAEIQASGIVTALEGGITRSGDVLTITFKDVLSVADKTTLDGDVTGPAGGLLAAHDNTPSPSGKLAQTVDGVLLTQAQVQTVDWQLCDRDIKLVTCTLGAEASEDLQPNMTTLLEEEWDECALVNVYKLNGTSDAMIPVTDQADADLNGVLSIWDYTAKDQTADPKTIIPYEIRDGGLVVDQTIPAAQRYAHRAYAIGAPDLHVANMHVRFFDGYLAAQPDGRVEAKSPQAKRMPADLNPAAGVLRIMIYHPAGEKRVHILRLVTYRPPGSF